MKLTYQTNLKPVYRVREKEVARKEKESRQNLWETVDTGNHYYGARYYQNKLSIWLSVDRLAEKYPHSSPYAYSGNNPVTFVDPNGDSLLVGSDPRSQNDILSTVSEENRSLVSFDANGNATINYGNRSEEEINELLESDLGLNLLDRVINSDKVYFYEVGDVSSNGISHWSGSAVNSNYSKDSYGNQFNIIENWSVTPRNNDGGAGGQGVRHAQYDGYVRISPGDFQRMVDGVPQSIPRASIVFHELAESFNRTSLGMPYTRRDGSGAHRSAKLLEGIWYTPFVEGPVTLNHRP